jgi:TRAP transporter TAXI family solute receptor
MKRVLIVTLVLIVALAAVITGYTPQKQFLSIATGGTGGVYFPLGGALAQILNKDIRNMEASARVTGASVANANLLATAGADGVEIAFLQNDIAYYSFHGLEMFRDRKNDQIRGIATLYPEVIQLIVTQASGIRSVRDLVGRRVAVGAAGSGTEANARQILSAFGVQYTALAKVEYLPFGDATAQIRDGHLDAAFVTAGTPTAAVTELANSIAIALVPITGPEVDALRTTHPFYTRHTIAAATYRGITEPVETIAVRAMIAVKGSLSDRLVYDITRALFKHLDDFGAAHVRGRDLSLATAQEAMPIPLHPGAARFFRERR